MALKIACLLLVVATFASAELKRDLCIKKIGERLSGITIPVKVSELIEMVKQDPEKVAREAQITLSSGGSETYLAPYLVSCFYFSRECEDAIDESESAGEDQCDVVMNKIAVEDHIKKVRFDEGFSKVLAAKSVCNQYGPR